ncbi:hypothetical protein TcBrA4_0075220 [Trypanosoma cruzi]|nr:hypothetical protein TcBrA4_0075220 [Trypanosoma cruzi]
MAQSLPTHSVSARRRPHWQQSWGAIGPCRGYLGRSPLAFVRVGGGGRGFKRRVAFAAHSFMRWPAFWCLPGPAPSEFTAGVPGDEGRAHGVLLAGCCRRGFECGAERVQRLLDASRSASPHRSLSRSLRSACSAATVVRSNSASPEVQNGEGWRLLAGTVAVTAFCVSDVTCLSVLSVPVNSRGILQSWLVTSLCLFQSASFHFNSVRLGLGTATGVSSSTPVRASKRTMQWSLPGESFCCPLGGGNGP